MKPSRPIALMRLARLPLALAAAFVLAAPAHTEDAGPVVYSIAIPYGTSQQLGQLILAGLREQEVVGGPLDREHADRRASRKSVSLQRMGGARAQGAARPALRRG